MNTPARKRRPAGQRAKPITATAEGAFEDGKSEVESLKGEIGEWKKNLESNSMEHLPKYDEVSECSDALESATDTFDSIDFPSCLSDVQVVYTQDTRQSAGSRSGRMSNALAALYAAKQAGEDWLENNPELEVVERGDPEDDDYTEEDVELDGHQTFEQSEADQRDEDRSAVEEFISQMDDGLGELENASFPGMY